ncbi:MAG: DNA mismatch repair endonuclease MutL [Deltaproteobacteria bacterium]|nr:DNA mismatch repair endonuclease MutL [Deltaproteobacteria bacterium]
MAPPAAGGRIRVLPEELAIQIAAGEVIERPASVVKELLENALDAGARRVVIEIEDGGLRSIRVSDDGEGMGVADAALAFTRHATSKIRNAADLTRIATFGFRGEALPSIAAVAAVELVTRERGAASGVAVRTDAGAVVEVRAAGAPEGTTVTVRDLFAPVPARRKFLKSVATELGHVVELVTRESLAAPGVHFRLLHQGRELAAYPPVAGIAERARQILGRERVRDGRVLGEERLGIAVRGFLLSAQLSFASGRYLYTYVNGRAVRDRALTHAIVEGYSSLVPRGRWPGAIVLLEVPPGDVDVNVHPAKHEVRFRLAHVVHDSVVTAVRRALQSMGAPPPGDAGSVAEALQRYASRLDATRPLALVHPAPRVRGADAAVAATADGPVSQTAATVEGGSAERFGGSDVGAGRGFAQLRFVGQVFRGYIVCEGGDRLVLVDQHAAHERVAFERLRAEYQAGAIERQALLLPVAVDLDPGRAETVRDAQARLASLGFDVEPFGETTFLVRAVPAILGDDDPGLLLEDLADGLATHGSHLSAAESVEAVLGRIACHSVVRVGRALTADEIAALLAALDALTYGSNCPHGRPVSIEFTRGQIERMFGR